MAKISLILQAATDNTHAAAVRELLHTQNPERILISVGFLRETGVAALEDHIKLIAEKATFFVGIRNDITTVQGLKRLLALKGKVYAVDTGSRDTIFHPKLYLAWNKDHGRAVVGSANMTFQGLHNNIEASAIVTLDMKVQDDRAFVEETEQIFNKLVEDYPRHVFKVGSEDEVDKLFQTGRLSDERIVPAPSTLNRIHKGERDTLPRMKLKRIAQPHLETAIVRSKTKKYATGPAPKAAAAAPPAIPPINPPVALSLLPEDEFYLVWESKPLTERDLNIPKSENTHATGSMSLDKGLLENVDHRHFFYDDVFDGLKWTKKPGKPHLATADAEFEIVVKNINYGTHNLTISHNSNTNSKSYKQRNAMTGLRWGDAKFIVAKADLKGRTLSLYRKDRTSKPPQFMIEID